MAQVTVREARVEDCQEIFRLSMELMVLENIAGRFAGTIESIRRDGFGNKKRFACFVAEDQNVLKSDRPVLAGMLLYTWMYRAGECGHVVHVEQIYITEKNRRQGIGTTLFQKALQRASEERLLRLQLVVSNTNIAALDFYKKLGGMDAMESPGWKLVRVYGDKIKENAERLNKSQSSEQNSTEGCVLADSGSTRLSVRDACIEDCDEIFRLKKEMAVYEGESDRFKTDIECIRQNGFEDQPKFHCFVVEKRHSSESDKPKLIGFLLYTWMYKVWLGSDTMWIEDVFVTEEHRGTGVGTALFEQALKIKIQYSKLTRLQLHAVSSSKE